MAAQGAKGLKRIIKAIQFSWQGFKAAYKNEEAFRQEVVLAFVTIPLGIYLGENGIEKSLLVGVIFIILIAELLNTGIEATVDRISTDKHELSGRAKDVGSAVVFLSIINAVITWGLVLYF